MKNKSRFFYWIFKKVYTTKQIKTLNKAILKNVTDGIDEPASGVLKTAVVKLINSSQIPLLEDYYNCLYTANTNNFGYNIFAKPGNGPLMNYNIYDSQKKGQYDFHLDMSYDNPVYDLKLTCLLNLSMAPYQGGDFFLFPNSPVVELKDPGNAVVFPSFFLHKVTPVTKGKRISLTLFGRGPKFQ